jgi:hypothetical protein
MKKRVLIIALISIAIVVGLSFGYFLFEKRFILSPKNQISKIVVGYENETVILSPKNLSEQIEKYPEIFVGFCPPPEEGYVVCHLKDDEVVKWNGEPFKCGEMVFLQAKLKYDPSKYYACRGGDLLIGVSENPQFKNFFFCEEDPNQNEVRTSMTGKIPLKEGKFNLLEVYLIPRQFPLDIEKIKSNLNQFEKILDLKANIKCKPK